MIRIFLWTVFFLLQIMTGRGTCINSPHFTEFVQSIAPQDSLRIRPGMFHTYFLQDKYYWEIPETLLERDFLVTTTALKAAARVTRSPEERWGYGNDMFQGAVLRFAERAGQLDILEVLPNVLKDSLPGGIPALYQEKLQAGRYMTLKILKRDSAALLVDVTDLLTGRNSILGLNRHGMDLHVGRVFPEYSGIPEIGEPQEEVLLIRSVQCYQPSIPAEQPAPGDFPLPLKTPWEIGTALCLLPEQPLAIRRLDGRVEYFVDSFKTYGENPFAAVNVAGVKRWRLEPSPQDMERYKTGELVEPVKPIVFYIDRNTPHFLVPYFISAVKAWSKAFEKIGFKNAIRAFPEPENDPRITPDNPYCSYISYLLSPRQNATGGIITDPRSGEILSGRVSVYHSFLDIVQQWYFNQCAQVDPGIHPAVIPDTLLAHLAEFVISHEVGHSLGLCHNFMGSSAYSVEQIRDADFVAEHGFGTSIMDYMRFNHLAQPEDHIALQDLIPRVGKYDEFAIAWGYRFFPDKSEEVVFPALRQWVTGQQQQRELRFGGMSSSEPESQAEDLSDDLLVGNALGIENLKYIARNLADWKKYQPGYEEVWKGRQNWRLFQYTSFINQVTTFIGGMYQEQQGYVQVPREKQMQAIDFLKTYAFPAANWLFESEKEQNGFYQDLCSALIRKCVQLQHNQDNFSDTELLAEEYVRLLHQAIFVDAPAGEKLSEEKKSLQRTYIREIQQTIDRNTSPAVSVMLYQELKRILEEAEQKTEHQEDMLYWYGVKENMKFWMNH